MKIHQNPVKIFVNIKGFQKEDVYMEQLVIILYVTKKKQILDQLMVVMLKFPVLQEHTKGVVVNEFF